ncbi:hypothetical protein L249_0875 [Ophiocordyceps polyrhachis-furcata BCC 54312]|uniref:Uncharacterized protein n=1 Tax=Ophiocordyceps polyrhachis-furcata BCC 54312 TaxID=1330021 RepID=A0A367LE16_9HYPO|nr:hypothetical protein L249_0875 [Ophiocordyceps polyrhachis-furcata BCC 54312]
MQYERLLFDFYVETGDKDPILNPRESSSELSDPFVSSPTDLFAELLSELSDFSINTPSDLLFNNSKGNKAAKKIAAKEQKTTTKKISRYNRPFKNPTLFCAEGRTLSKKAKTLVVTLKAIAL